MKNITLLIAMLIFVAKSAPTGEKLSNHEDVWNVVVNGTRVGEFLPVHSITLVTKNEPSLFNGSVEVVMNRFNGTAITPGGMTSDTTGVWQLEGQSLSSGKPCGDGIIRNYGLLLISKDSRKAHERRCFLAGSLKNVCTCNIRK